MGHEIRDFGSDKAGATAMLELIRIATVAAMVKQSLTTASHVLSIAGLTDCHTTDKRDYNVAGSDYDTCRYNL